MGAAGDEVAACCMAVTGGGAGIEAPAGAAEAGAAAEAAEAEDDAPPPPDPVPPIFQREPRWPAGNGAPGSCLMNLRVSVFCTPFCNCFRRSAVPHSG